MSKNSFEHTSFSVVSFLALLGLLGLLASPAIAQLESVKVWERLQAAYTKVDNQDFAPIMYHIAKAKDDGQHVHRHLFLAGEEYVIIAACDDDCTDLELAVTVPEERKTYAKDDRDLPVAQLAFSPSDSGLYTVEIVVADCGELFCYYGYTLLRKAERPKLGISSHIKPKSQ